MDHSTHGCTHDLKLCKDCDVVYCRACKREWGDSHVVWKYTPPWTWTYPNTIPAPYFGTSGGTFADNPISSATNAVTCASHN